LKDLFACLCVKKGQQQSKIRDFCVILRLTMAQRYRDNNLNGVCKPLKRLLIAKGLTIMGLAQLMGRSKVQLHTYLNNPYLMTLGQLSTLAGHLDTNVIELHYLIRLNKPKVEKVDISNLSSVVEKYKDLE
jgi:hypothetical protein